MDRSNWNLFFYFAPLSNTNVHTHTHTHLLKRHNGTKAIFFFFDSKFFYFFSSNSVCLSASEIKVFDFECFRIYRKFSTGKFCSILFSSHVDERKEEKVPKFLQSRLNLSFVFFFVLVSSYFSIFVLFFGEIFFFAKAMNKIFCLILLSNRCRRRFFFVFSSSSSRTSSSDRD